MKLGGNGDTTPLLETRQASTTVSVIFYSYAIFYSYVIFYSLNYYI
jgi:hypothetical protein